MCSAKPGRSSLNALNQRCLSCNCSNCMSSCMKRICKKKGEITGKEKQPSAFPGR